MKSNPNGPSAQGAIQALSKLRPAAVKAGLVLMLHAAPLTMIQWASLAGMAPGTLLAARAELEAFGFLQREDGKWSFFDPDSSKIENLTPFMNDMNDFKKKENKPYLKIIHSFIQGGGMGGEVKNRDPEKPAPEGLAPVLERLQELGVDSGGLRAALRDTPFGGAELVEVARAIVDTLLVRPKDFKRPGGFAVSVFRDRSLAKGLLSEARARWQITARAKTGALEAYMRAKEGRGSRDPIAVADARAQLVEILWAERGDAGIAKIQHEVAKSLEGASEFVRERALKHHIGAALLREAGLEV